MPGGFPASRAAPMTYDSRVQTTLASYEQILDVPWEGTSNVGLAKKIHQSFSITPYRTTQMKFLASPVVLYILNSYSQLVSTHKKCRSQTVLILFTL